jgi:hypothetical protein
MADNKNARKKSGSGNLLFWGVLGLLLAYPAIRTRNARNPLSFMIPNFLLFTPFRDLTRSYWNSLLKVDTAVKREPLHVPIIEAKDYSFESLREATEGFRYPAVVRGLFSDVPGVKKWSDVNYLNSRLGDFDVPVVRKAVYNTLQNDRAVMPFSEAATDILTNPDSKMYLFFPVESRFNFNHSDLGKAKALKEAVNRMVADDLEIGERIWKGFGTKAHSTYHGAQLIVGRGSNDSDATTGTGWHCAAGNNWFIQVVGKKRWYFMDPVHSAYMSPLRGGKVNMMTGNRNMVDIHANIPLRYADIQAGDLLYNPDWEWHTIKNYEGLSIGCPIREFNVSLSVQNNMQYTGIVLLNKVLDYFKIDLGGYPPN